MESKLVNVLGRTYEEQQQKDEEAKSQGSLWGNLADTFVYLTEEEWFMHRL